MSESFSGLIQVLPQWFQCLVKMQGHLQLHQYLSGCIHQPQYFRSTASLWHTGAPQVRGNQVDSLVVHGATMRLQSAFHGLHRRHCHRPAFYIRHSHLHGGSL